MPRTITNLVLAIATMAMAASTQAYTFTKVAGTNTAIPNGAGNFTGLSNARIQNSNIVFYGSGDSGQAGFYRWNNGNVTRVVDLTMTVPETGATFTNLPSYDGRFSEVNDFLFSANTTSTKGLYRWNAYNDTLTQLIDTTATIPGRSESFLALRALYQVQPPGRTVFVGYSTNGSSGIYFLSGTNVTTLVNGYYGTLPGTAATFSLSDNGVLQSGGGGNIAFTAYKTDNSRGIYCYSYATNQLFTIADTNTVVPGRVVKFTTFTDPPALHNGRVVFYGGFSGGSGLYSANADGTGLTTLVDTDMYIPGTTNKLSSLFNGYAYSNGRLLFYSSYFDNNISKSRPGIYLLESNVVSTVVDSFTSLDGQTPANLGVGGIDSSGSITFVASFGAGFPYTPAVYTTLSAAPTTVQFTLTTNVSPLGGGSIQLSPDSGDGKYDSNSIVQLTAVAASGKAFAGWSGAVTGSSNPIQVTMSANKSVTATFTNIPVGPTYTLTTNVTPAGYGSIAVDPSGSSFDANTVVTLTATPATGKVFVHWTGASTATTNSISLTMSANKSITAVFTNAPQFYVLSTNVNPSDTGTITVTPAPTTNGYAAGTTVTLTAAPKTGYKFVKWSGASVALTTRIAIKMTGDKTVTALFTNLPIYHLNVALSPTNAGAVLKSAGINSNDYYFGTIASLIPMADVGFKFVKWTGGLAGAANPGKVLMNANKTVTAVFKVVPTYVLTTGVTPIGAGDVFADPDLPGSIYSSGAVVSLTAQANGTNQFAAWAGPGLLSLSNQVNVTMNSNKTVNAVFNNPGKLYWQSVNSFVTLWFMQNSNYVASGVLNDGKAILRTWRLAATVDFDNDGNKDLLFQNNNGSVMLWMMTNNTIIRTQALKTAPLGLKLVGAGHFTTNTTPDLLWQNANGSMVVWTFDGTNYTGLQNISSTNIPTKTFKALAVADLNNDGQTDIIFQGADRRVTVWFMNGTTMASSVVLNNGLPAPIGWTLATVTDLDDNGSPDILFQVARGKSSVWTLDGTNKLSESFMANGSAMPLGWSLRAAK